MNNNSKYNRRNEKNNFKFQASNSRKNKNDKTKEERINKKERKNENPSFDDQVEGRNSVLELLESEKDINKIYISNGEKQGSINKIVGKAKSKGIVLVEVDKNKLDEMSQTGNHQGVIAIVPPFEYCEVDDILDEAKMRKEDAFILILDGIEDPHNLGAIIRTAETAGVHGVIIPKRRAVAVNSTVNKSSAGAVEHMKIARVNNINDTIKYLKDNGLWVIGTDGNAQKYYYEQAKTLK